MRRTGTGDRELYNGQWRRLVAGNQDEAVTPMPNGYKERAFEERRQRSGTTTPPGRRRAGPCGRAKGPVELLVSTGSFCRSL